MRFFRTFCLICSLKSFFEKDFCSLLMKENPVTEVLKILKFQP